MDSLWLYSVLTIFYGTIWFTHFTKSAAPRTSNTINILYFILIILSTNSDLDTHLIVVLGIPILIPLVYTPGLGDTGPDSGVSQNTAVEEGYALCIDIIVAVNQPHDNVQFE